MELGKHQGSHCKDYNTHISQWQVAFQQVTSRQAAVRAGIQCHFLSPPWNTDSTAITIFTTLRHFARIRCRRALSRHLQGSSGSCAHHRASRLACGRLRSANNTNRWWDSTEEEILWSCASEPLLIVRRSVSLSPLDGAKWHAWWHAAGYAVAPAVRTNGKEMWNRDQASFEPRHFLVQEQQKVHEVVAFPNFHGFHAFMLLYLSKAENENLKKFKKINKNNNSISQISILFQRVGCIQQFPTGMHSRGTQATFPS